MLLLVLLVLACTAIGWLCGHPVAGLIVGVLLAVLGVHNEVAL